MDNQKAGLRTFLSPACHSERSEESFAAACTKGKCFRLREAMADFMGSQCRADYCGSITG
jgi:hypothetical protein